ncbi:hypothetical protein JCM5353_003915 [Sporobolomyces roseus]
MARSYGNKTSREIKKVQRENNGVLNREVESVLDDQLRDLQAFPLDMEDWEMDHDLGEGSSHPNNKSSGQLLPPSSGPCAQVVEKQLGSGGQNDCKHHSQQIGQPRENGGEKGRKREEKNRKSRLTVEDVKPSRKNPSKRKGKTDGDGETGQSEGKKIDYPFTRGEDWVRRTIETGRTEQQRRDYRDYYRRLYKSNGAFVETDEMVQHENDLFRARKKEIERITGKAVHKGMSWSEPAGSSKRPSKSSWNYGVVGGTMGDAETGKTMATKALFNPGFESQGYEWNFHDHTAKNGSEVKNGNLPTLPVGTLNSTLASSIAEKVSRPHNRELYLSTMVPDVGETTHLHISGKTQGYEFKLARTELLRYARSKGRRIRVEVEAMDVEVEDFVSEEKVIKGGTVKQEVIWIRDLESKLIVSQVVETSHLSHYLLPTGNIKGAVIADEVFSFKAELDLQRSIALSVSRTSSTSSNPSPRSPSSVPPLSPSAFNDLSTSPNVQAFAHSSQSISSAFLPYSIGSRLLTVCTARGEGSVRPKDADGRDSIARAAAETLAEVNKKRKIAGLPTSDENRVKARKENNSVEKAAICVEALLVWPQVFANDPTIRGSVSAWYRQVKQGGARQFYREVGGYRIDGQNKDPSVAHVKEWLLKKGFFSKP